MCYHTQCAVKSFSIGKKELSSSYFAFLRAMQYIGIESKDEYQSNYNNQWEQMEMSQRANKTLNKNRKPSWKHRTRLTINSGLPGFLNFIPDWLRGSVVKVFWTHNKAKQRKTNAVQDDSVLSFENGSDYQKKENFFNNYSLSLDD